MGVWGEEGWGWGDSNDADMATKMEMGNSNDGGVGTAVMGTGGQQ